MHHAAPGTLALLGGPPARRHSRPRFPVFSERAKARVVEVLEVGNMVGLSKENRLVEEAEATVAEWHGVEHCLGTSSGHGALHAALIGLEITAGDEVITTPYSWGASTSCILHNGAIPVFADVDPDTGLLDPAAVEPLVGRRTRAILVTHIYGQPADMTSIRRVADRHGLAVIEDGSQAHGARHRGTRVGAFGDVSGFSCMGGKLLATSEAGYLLTSSPSVYWNATLSCHHAGGTEHPGRSSEEGFPRDLRPHIDSLTYTYRLSTLSAVLIVEQLAKLDEENLHRGANRAAWIDAMAGVESVVIPQYSSQDEAVFHMVTFNFNAEHAGVAKGTYIDALQAEGVPAFSYIATPLHRLARLSPTTKAPRVMWTEILRREAIDYDDVHLPGCDAKVEQSIEMTWNYITPVAAEMHSLADAFVKVEEQLPALREYERRTR